MRIRRGHLKKNLWVRPGSMFAMCLGLSLCWHLLGVVSIGTIPEASPARVGPVVPTLCLSLPVDVLDVGRDGAGAPVYRAVAGYRDPEYFGFPRLWACGRYQEIPGAGTHIPSLPEDMVFQIPPPPRQMELTQTDSEAFALEEETGTAGIFFDERMVMRPGVRESVQDRLGHLDFEGALHSGHWVITGPAACRTCLVQIVPGLDPKQMGKERNLVLGRGVQGKGGNGLRILFWVVPDGTVKFVQLESSSGNRQADDIALRSVLQWRFAPLADAAGPTQWGSAGWVDQGE